MRQQRFLLPLLLLALTACGGNLPGFLGREGSGSGSVREAAPLPDPVPMAARTVTVEPGRGGTIIRVDIVAPTQGFHSAELTPSGNGEPDEFGAIGFALSAIPPEGAQAVGPERTRTLHAAVFVADRARRPVRTVNIVDATGTRTLRLR